VTPLLDVNVLVALAWSTHVHHYRAVDWFSHRAPAAWATAPVTQAGFIRVSSNRKVAFERLTGYRQVTDAHLLALAVRHAGRLVTFDSAVAELADRSDRVVVLRL
jgi:predicted nucleic acid-binding protein